MSSLAAREGGERENSQQVSKFANFRIGLQIPGDLTAQQRRFQRVGD